MTVSASALVVYMKHARPDSEKTRFDTWLGPILPIVTWFRYQAIGRATCDSVLGESQHVVVGPMIPRTRMSGQRRSSRVL